VVDSHAGFDSFPPRNSWRSIAVLDPVRQFVARIKAEFSRSPDHIKSTLGLTVRFKGSQTTISMQPAAWKTISAHPLMRASRPLFRFYRIGAQILLPGRSFSPHPSSKRTQHETNVIHLTPATLYDLRDDLDEESSPATLAW
jgi:hypothetical protein